MRYTVPNWPYSHNLVFKWNWFVACICGFTFTIVSTSSLGQHVNVSYLIYRCVIRRSRGLTFMASGTNMGRISLTCSQLVEALAGDQFKCRDNGSSSELSVAWRRHMSSKILVNIVTDTAWWHQATSWTNADLSPIGSHGACLNVCWCKCIKYKNEYNFSKMTVSFPETKELIVNIWHTPSCVVISLNPFKHLWIFNRSWGVTGNIDIAGLGVNYGISNTLGWRYHSSPLRQRHIPRRHDRIGADARVRHKPWFYHQFDFKIDSILCQWCDLEGLW